VIQRKTQTAEYWRNLNLSQNDLQFLQTIMLDAGKPLTTLELAERLVTERCRSEEAQLRSELARGTLYQPKKSFAAGDSVIFPVLDFRLGTVVEVRPGENPEYGEFDVISVDFGADRRRRMFAARLDAPHRLNLEEPDLSMAGDPETPAELLASEASGVPAALAEALAQQAEFVRFEEAWMRRDLLTEIHVGHLNIAEALIEVQGSPAATTDLVKELDIPAEVAPEVARFSVQSVLAADERFDQVGTGAERRWFLKRLEPSEALEMPGALRYRPEPFDRGALTSALRLLEWELDDEWSEGTLESERMDTPTTTLLLTYPHLVSGTLPLNRHSRPFFPRGFGERTMVSLIDGRWGQRFPGWAVHEGRYLAGLRGWFEKHKLPAGALISLQRHEGSDEILVDFRPKRMRREWTRWAQVMDGRLDFQLRKQEVACEYDEHLIIGEDQSEELTGLRAAPFYHDAPLADLVYAIFTDLAGLSQQGSVNARTIYSALNVVRRCPPGPIFQCLATDERYQLFGEHEYRLAG